MNIKEIEERSGLTRANIRYYEQEGLLAPARRENKYRDYSEEDLETLLRIALLRNLGFSLDEIRRLQSGELELAAAMRERSAALESEGQRLLAARNVCDAISREVTSYSALRPEDYLNGFEPDAAAKQRDVAEPHPLRRYLARAIDLTLTGILVSFVQFMLLHHNLVNISKAEIFLCGLAGWGLLVLIEPLLLSRFAATAGKWCMGITVTRPDGERLSYGEALERTAAVWLYGAGLGISIVELVCNYRSYRRYMNGEELAWESGSIERFDERGTGRMVLLYAAITALSLALTLAMGLSAALPPNRGDLTVAEFAENVNFYRDFSTMASAGRSTKTASGRRTNTRMWSTSAGATVPRRSPTRWRTERSAPCIGHIPRRRKRSTARAMRMPAWRTSRSLRRKRARAFSTSAAW